MKLENYLKEERNIGSDISIVKKYVKDYISKKKKLKIDLYENVGKKAKSLAKSVEETEMEDFKYSIADWISNTVEQEDIWLSSDVATIIDAVIDKFY